MTAQASAYEALQRAIKAAGTQAELAKLIGCTQSAVSQWKSVPVRRLGAVEAATGIPRQELRPDIFGLAS